MQFAILSKNDAFVVKIGNTLLTKLLWPILPSTKGCQFPPPWLAQPELGRHNGEVDHLDWWPEEVVVHIHPWEPGHQVINKSSKLKDMII